MAHIFDYEPHPDYTVRLIETTRGWQRYLVSFPTAHPTPYEQTNRVWGEYFMPRNGSDLPLAILVHGLGDRSVFPFKLLARELARQRMAAFIIYLVTHSSRHLPVGRALTDDEWFENYRISVTDVRQVLDWRATRPELSQEKVGIVGLSFGGFIAAMSMGVDRRIRSGVLIASGGNLEKIGMRSRMLPRRLGFRKSEADFAAQQERYRRYLERVAKGEPADAPERGFLVDAMTYARYLRDRPLLMINARWDEIIPKEATLDFWEVAGRPPIAWLPGGHATVWLWYPIISRKVRRFLSASLA